MYPGDNGWSIGCDATNYEAVNRVYEIKQRDKSKGMIVLLENPNNIPSYIDEMPEVAWDLIDFTEKPTTIIYDKAKNLATNLIATDGTIGIRVTKEDFSQQLIQRFRKPLVSSSANISGESTPRNFYEVPDKIISEVDYVVNHRQDEMNTVVNSSVIKLGSSGLVKIIRK